MPVPSTKKLYRPVLELMHNASERVVSLQENRKLLAERLSLTDADLQERLRSGRQTRFENRADWAISDLKRAGLLRQTSRSHYQITSQGREFLAESPDDIKWSQLKSLIDKRVQQAQLESEDVESTPDHSEWPSAIDTNTFDSSDATPEEHIAELHTELNDRLADDLLESAKKISANQFERLVVDLLEEMGYGEGEPIGGPRDGGIDGVINQDALGLEKVYIQAKRWTENSVGSDKIQQFSGSLDTNGASKGVFITTSVFTTRAREVARFISAGNKLIRLIDGRELADLTIAHNVGVITEFTYHVKKPDENYFAEDV